MRRLAVVTLVVLAANALPRAAQAQTPVPRALEDWQAWVLKGREFHRCPFLAGSNPAVAESYRCAWPERQDSSLPGTDNGGTQPGRARRTFQSALAGLHRELGCAAGGSRALARRGAGRRTQRSAGRP